MIPSSAFPIGPLHFSKNGKSAEAVATSQAKDNLQKIIKTNIQ